MMLTTIDKIERVCNLGLRYISLNKEIERKYGISLVQWHFLLNVKDRPGCLAKELANALSIHPGSLTQTLKRLQKKELIVIMSHPNDARKKRISLSIKGFNQLKYLAKTDTVKHVNEFLKQIEDFHSKLSTLKSK